MDTARQAERMRTQPGFTLIELLIVVAIIGIIAAVAVPNLLNAVDKAKQKRTMADMRTISSAVEAYATDNALYPIGIATWPALKAVINPHFMKAPPDADAWSNIWDVSSVTGTDYTVASVGKDGLPDSRAGGQTNLFDCDIVFTNGRFFQWPEGPQS